MENEPSAMENSKSSCEIAPNGGINHVDSTPHARSNAANQAGSSFSPLPAATTFEEQLSKIESRGLAVEDRDFAIAKLRDLNYYRLRGYWLTLEHDGKFVQGATFDDIWEIYQLDRDLRRWLWQAIAPVEIKLRTQFAYELAHRCGSDAYLNEGNFFSSDGHARAVASYERERHRAYSQGVPHVVHNMDKYGKLPVWAAVEIMSFGTLSMFYGNLDFAAGEDEGGTGIAAAVADAFGTKPRYLKSWAHHLTTVRNIAAHHDRFYNRVMNIRPLLLRRDRRYANSKQFPTLIIIKRIYEKSWPDEWGAIGANLAACFDGHPSVDIAPMGMPGNWKQALGIL